MQPSKTASFGVESAAEENVDLVGNSGEGADEVVNTISQLMTRLESGRSMVLPPSLAIATTRHCIGPHREYVVALKLEP